MDSSSKQVWSFLRNKFELYVLQNKFELFFVTRLDSTSKHVWTLLQNKFELFFVTSLLNQKLCLTESTFFTSFLSSRRAIFSNIIFCYLTLRLKATRGHDKTAPTPRCPWHSGVRLRSFNDTAKSVQFFKPKYHWEIFSNTCTFSAHESWVQMRLDH